MRFTIFSVKYSEFQKIADLIIVFISMNRDVQYEAAVENGEIDFLRYRSYLNIMDGDDRKYR